jgi:chemotaxis response regulator CheB
MITRTMKSEPFIGVICDASFSMLAGRIKAAGYRIARVSPAMLASGNRPTVDSWVVDCEDPDCVAEALAEIEVPVVALSNRPAVEDEDRYREWVDRIIRTLDKWTANAWHGKSASGNSDPGGFAAVQGVWLLAGSSGMEAAAREFFEAMPWIPPVAFLYAQHVKPADEQALTNKLGKMNRHLRCELALGRNWFNPAQLLVVPASCRLEFGPQGEVFSLREPWGGRVDPHIDQLMMNVAGLTPQLSGVITFSGSSTDGLQGARALHDMSIKVWAQDPETATAPAMPRWVDKLRLASRVGSPADLAEEFMDLHPQAEPAVAIQAAAANDPQLETSSA